MVSRALLVVLFVLVAGACSRGREVTLLDSGPRPGTDAGTSPGTDSGTSPGTDTGTTTGDPCAASDTNAVSTVGCNGGFLTGEAPANTPSGACTGGGEPMPAGTCSAATLVCSAAAGAMGWCFPTCTAGATYVSRGTCPTGFRCFALMAGGVCFRDCDATHACPAGMTCDAEGSCVPPG